MFKTIYIILYSPAANSLSRSKSPTNPMTAMMAVNKFKSAGIAHSGQRHKNGSSGRRAAENKLIPPQHPSTAPSSPIHNRRFLSARPTRMSSVELPDDNEKSVSSASTSPCPSPKSHRLLATNLYVVLYNYTPRQEDELDLRAGYKLTVIDAVSDKDWWKGKCFGAVGVFPSNYVTQLHPGEKPLQVTQTVQINATSMQEPPIKLLRDQIVIQIEDRHGIGGGMGIDISGCILIRTDDHRKGFCPISHLQEV